MEHQGTRKVPYRLPGLVAAAAKRNGTPPRVYITEGEKDANRLAEWGFTATTNPGGAGKWRDEFSRYFGGFDVVILPDNDGPGRKHAQQVASNLAPAAASVRVIELQGLPDKGDISDWIAAGGSQSDLESLVEITKPFGSAGDWYSKCIAGRDGRTLCNVTNTLLALREDRAWADVFTCNEMFGTAMLKRPKPPREGP